MGNYTTRQFIDTFGCLPERGGRSDRNWAGPDIEDQHVLVGCICNNGKVYAGGVIPSRCPHCGGRGSLPRHKLRAITAPKSENHRPLED